MGLILFLQATKHLKDKGFNIEYLYAADIREHKPDWTHPSFLVDWLLDSDFHGLFCQGIHNQMFGIWKPIDCIEEIKRLEMVTPPEVICGILFLMVTNSDIYARPPSTVIPVSRFL